MKASCCWVRIANDGRLVWRGNSCVGGYSTAGDIARYFAALRGGKLLSPALLATMTATASEPYPGVEYGMGFARDIVASKLLVGHSGGGSAVGIGVGPRVLPDSGWSIAVMGNYDLQFAESLATDINRLVAMTDDRSH